MMKSHLFVLGIVGILLLQGYGCDSGPKVIESESGAAGEPQIRMEQEDPIREVVVEEVLHTDKYSYLSVKEGDKGSYWIAIPRSEVEVGDALRYKGGLMKQNFYSREYDRTFETLYLVSDIRRAGASPGELQTGNDPEDVIKVEPGSIKPAEGAIRIADLLAAPSRYANKTVRVTGKVVKVNPMIMSRNWVHLQDGSGKDLDLTFTTTDLVTLGSVVTLEGKVALNKDFGAGYRYDVIVEDSRLIP